MDSKDRNLFDRLDSIESQQEEILKSINQLNKANQSNEHVNKQQLSNKEILSIFIKKAKKEYLWFGPNLEFSKSKRLVILSCVGIFIVGLISTILTSIAFGMYSTFSLFENIIIFEASFILYHSYNCKKIISDEELKNCHCDVFQLNVNNAWCTTGKEKKRYKVFRIISYIAVIANIIIIWTKSNGGIAVAATIFEVLFLAITIINHFLNVDLFCMYNNFVIITGRNLSNTETVKLVYDVISNKLITYKDFEDKFKILIYG